MKKTILIVILVLFSSTSFAIKEDCKMDNQTESYVNELFENSEYLYSLLWWESKESKIINARSFIINGVDMVPIFPTKEEAIQQVTGSGYEKDIVAIKPSLLSGILQNMEYAIVNPGSNNPIVFKTCSIKKYIEKIK